LVSSWIAIATSSESVAADPPLSPIVPDAVPHGVRPLLSRPPQDGKSLLIAPGAQTRS
jgi:hypothetical protein